MHHLLRPGVAAEFWKFTGIYMLGALIIICIETFVLGVPEDSITVFYAIYMLVHVLPGIAVTVRRLHDIDRNGAWFLLLFTGIGIIVLLVFMLTPGVPGPNRYGAAPEAFAEPTGQRIDPHDHRIDPHAHAHAPEQPHQRAPAAQGDPIAEIERLAHLRAAGGLTDAEFEVLKARALSRLTES
ncbi:DUF805 domain-containing protein [Aureimonas altamirensis]|uniref:DUF805 domain-containing protein n=1 Tax=Aureimonas altamirensis TaxID=370622 RepID=UPI0033377857